MRALVVDDQRDFYESIRPVLFEQGFRSVYAADLAAATREVASRVFDLLISA
jgi:DNA-binding response OmpR family regulator